MPALALGNRPMAIAQSNQRVNRNHGCAEATIAAQNAIQLGGLSVIFALTFAAILEEEFNVKRTTCVWF